VFGFFCGGGGVCFFLVFFFGFFFFFFFFWVWFSATHPALPGEFVPMTR